MNYHKEMNLPDNKELKENTYYFWSVTNPLWNDGERKRVRLKFKNAKFLSATVNYKVEYSLDQTKPEGGASGSQKALIYGSSAKETKKAKGIFKQ